MNSFRHSYNCRWPAQPPPEVLRNRGGFVIDIGGAFRHTAAAVTWEGYDENEVGACTGSRLRVAGAVDGSGDAARHRVPGEHVHDRLPGIGGHLQRPER